MEKECGEYLSAKFPELTQQALFKPHKAIALVSDDDVMVGTIAFRLQSTFEGSISMAIEDWRAFPGRKVLSDLFKTIFVGTGLKRLTLTIARGNKKARRLAEHLGFKLEGVKRLGFDGRQHGCIYGMLADECLWIKGGD